MIDWLTVMDEQSAIVYRMTQKVPVALRNPNLNLDVASRIGELVQRGAHDFYDLLDLMQSQRDPRCASLMAMARRLEGLWAGLSRMTADRLRALQGIAPGPMKRAA